MSDASLGLLVVGAGACGLAAAVAAHDAGIEVAIVGKLDRPGGNSSLSTGSVPGAGSRYQRDAGGRVGMFTQAPAGFDNGTATNLWLPDGTPVFMTPRYLHYV